MISPDLLDDYHADRLTDAEAAEFEEKLRTDDAFAEEVFTQLQMDALLTVMHDDGTTRQNLMDSVCAHLRSSSTARLKKGVLAEITDIEEGPVCVLQPPVSRRRSLSRTGYWVALAACAAIAFLLLATRPGPGTGPTPIATVRSASGAVVIKRGQANTIAKAGQEVAANDFIELSDSTGSISITYPDGTVLVLDNRAAATLSISEDGGKAIDLIDGYLKMNAAPQPDGAPLTINTPNGTATVVGTEFAIVVRDQLTRLAVAHGEVNLANTSGSSASVKAGYVASAVADFAISPQPFIGRNLADLATTEYSYLHWKSYSESLAGDPDLVVYYDFQDEDERNDTVSNKALVHDGHLSGKMVDGDWTSGRWITGKRGIFLQNPGYVDCGTKGAFDLSGPMSVFVWFRVASFDRDFASLIAKGDSAWRLARYKESNVLEFACQDLQPEFFIRGKSNVVDGQWHLAVGVYDGQQLILYVDGREDGRAKASGAIRQNNKPVTIGQNVERSGRFFAGWIDELGVMSRALTAEEVRRMYEAGMP